MHLEFDADSSSGMYEQSPVEDLLEVEPKVGGDVHADTIDFFVAGEPVPQGSTKSFYIKKLDRVVTTHGNRNTERWRQRIATEAQHTNETRAANFFCDDRRCGYQVTLDFVFTKPKSTPKKHNLNTKRPDLDKLIRAVLDGITGVLIPDDAQVISITASKSYCCGDEAPGLRISVRRLNG